MTNEIELYNTTTNTTLSNLPLTDEQISIVHLLGAGLTMRKVSQISKIGIQKITSWMKGDPVFIQAVNSAAETKDKIIQDKLSQAGMLAAEYAIDLLSEIPQDDLARKLQADIAKTFIQAAHSKKITMSVEVPTSIPSNIEDGSREIIDRFNKKPAEIYTVLNNVNIPDTEALLAIGTKLGEMNYDEENKKFQCHICGQWHYDLVFHVRKYHSMSAPRYREMYNIPDGVVFYPTEPIEVTEINE